MAHDYIEEREQDDIIINSFFAGGREEPGVKTSHGTVVHLQKLSFASIVVRTFG